MKKLYFFIPLFSSALTFGQQSGSLTQHLGVNPNPTNSAIQKTYTTCTYLQEGNGLEDGYVSNTLFPEVVADDFIVPAGECWEVNYINAPFFVYDPTDAQAITVNIYADAGGAPGSVVSSYMALPSDFTTSYKGSNYGLDVYDYLINIPTPFNLCGGVSGTTYWLSVQVTNTVSNTDFYWEVAYSSPYGTNNMSAGTSSGPWNALNYNSVFEIFHGTTFNNITLTECQGFSITVGSNTYTTTGVYQDVLTGVSGCDSIINLDLTILDLGYSTDSYTVCDSLVWIDGLTYYASNNVATYVLSGAASSGCDSIITLDLTVNGPDMSVVQSGVQLNAVETGATYQWLDCNDAYVPVSGATNQNFTFPSNGSFAVQITSNGCTDTSACFLIDYSGTIEHENTTISVYPNPANSNLQINGLADLNNISLINITSLTGAVVYSSQKPSGLINVSDLMPGVYFLMIYHDAGRSSLRFTIE